MSAPIVLACTLCEDVRPEMSGKAILIGYFGTLPYVDMWVGDLKRPVDRLSLLFLVDKGEGAADFCPRIVDSSGINVIAQSQGGFMVKMSPLGRTNVGVAFPNLAMTTPGEYRVQVHSGKELIYESSFNVFEGQPPQFPQGS